MEPTQFVIRIALLALPGVLGSKLYRKLRGRTQKKHWEDFLEIMVFSLASYTICGVFMAWHSKATHMEKITPRLAASQPTSEPAPWTGISSFKAFCDASQPLVWKEILAASGIGIALGILAGYVHNFSLVTRFGRLIRATKRTGDEDIWQTFCDSPQVRWVFVRDHQLNLMYYGFLRHYSDSGKERELTLENVEVFTNDTAEPLYSSAAMYISRPSHQLTVEIPIELSRNTRTKGDSSKEPKDGNNQPT